MKWPEEVAGKIKEEGRQKISSARDVGNSKDGR